MKKYKFKVGEVVSTLGISPNPSIENFRLIVITKRQRIGDTNYYEANLYNNDDLDMVYYIDNDFPEWNEDCNYLIEEKYLYPKDYTFIFDYPPCSNNGCEVILNYLEDNTPEETEEEKEIAFLSRCIERSQTLVNSYGAAIYALQKSIEEETISINKLRNKLAILTGDDTLYASTFIYTIED